MKSKWLSAIPFAGATISFFIGSGFATAQEIMQYFVAYGWQFTLVILVSMAIFFYTNWSFIHAGTQCGMKKSGDAYIYYCGKYIGTFYDWFAILFIFLSYVTMCGGAGAVTEQQFGLPKWVGVALLATLVIVTTIFGLKGLVDVLGMVGPVIIVCIFLLGIYTTIRDWNMISAGLELIQSDKVELIRVGSNFFTSAVSYAGFVMLWFCTFMAKLGAENDAKTVRRGMGLGTAAIAISLACVSMGLIANVEAVAGTDIPNATLAATISPVLATAFSVVVMCSIYTTSTPLLWTVTAQFFKEGTAKYRIAAVALGIAGALISLFLPYKNLVNIIYGINGYVGIGLIFFMVYRDIRTVLVRKKDAANHSPSQEKVL